MPASVGGDACFGERGPHRHAAGAPDVVGGLLDEVLVGTEYLDRLDADARAVARTIEEPGPHAAGTDVHPEIRARGHDLGMLRPRRSVQK